MACEEFPDNSVVCHARRLSGLAQDTFISGAALGVNCSDQPLPFFPDIYNEDWFFFSRLAARRELAKVGEATQAPYDPYKDPLRARQEEFGDLLAEGIYALFEDQPPEMEFADRLTEATEEFWKGFIESRWDGIVDTRERLTRRLDGVLSDAEQKETISAVACLEAAGNQLSRLRPALCVAFLKAWQSDLTYWEGGSQRVNAVSSSTEALGLLGLTSSEDPVANTNFDLRDCA
jgi:hypothetical protein